MIGFIKCVYASEILKRIVYAMRDPCSLQQITEAAGKYRLSG